MPFFGRHFQFFGRMFPPAGDLAVPREVSEDVQLVHEIYRADRKHVIYLRSKDASGAGAGANITVDLISEPAQAGYVACPYLVAIFATGNAAPVRVQIQMQTSAAPLTESDLTTGSWPAGAVATFLTVDLTADHWTIIPVSLPLPRQNNLLAQFETVPVGTTIRTRSFSVDLPIEVVDWQPPLGSMSGFVRQGAM